MATPKTTTSTTTMEMNIGDEALLRPGRGRGSPIVRLRDASEQPDNSGDEPETARPGDLLGRGQLDLEEPDRLELTGTGQVPRVDGREPTVGDDPGQHGLRVRVVAGDQHGGGLRADRAGGKGRGEVGVERLDHPRLREGGGDLG